MDTHKAAFIVVIGRPSAGKSTLVNTICGQKLAIVSPVPQTTRNSIRGIKTGDNYQLIFLDTPGLHKSDKKMNKYLKDSALRSLSDADIILYVIDSTRKPGEEEENIISLILPYKDKVIIAANKIDSSESNAAQARLFIAEMLNTTTVFDISAKTGAGIENLLACLVDAAPEGPQYYPPEYYTDQEPVFRIAEVIREKILLNTKEEIPHAVYIEYSSHHVLDNGTLVYEGELIVERESQKRILIGSKAAMIKRIREEAEADLLTIFPYPVKLSLTVSVNADWKKDERILKKLIH